MIDYNRLATVCEQMVANAGRSVTLIRKSRTPSDALAPWKGPSTAGTLDTEVEGHAVFVHPTALGELGRRDEGEAIERRAQQIALVAAAPQADQLELFDALTDTLSGAWRILWVETLQPGEVRILYMIGLRR